ncbi:MAG: hypothetical protein MZW92_06625 [Comamonadaceae bacterium]|nr:hypothetical protein [Comamonadaceae bacterium]
MRKEAITVRLTVPDDLPAVLCNAQELQRVVLNIIGNARYALQEKYPHAHDDKVLEITGATVVKDTGPAVRLHLPRSRHGHSRISASPGS